MKFQSGTCQLDFGVIYSGHFCRAMLCIVRTMLSQDVRPSVCHTPVFYRNG